MSSLTIRNLDDSVVETLKARAKANSRSLEAELRHILMTEAERPVSGAADRQDVLRMIDRIRAMTPAVAQSDSTLLIREDRDR